MKKAKAPKVPVLEQAFELNLPKLMRAAKTAERGWLVLSDGDVRTVVMLAGTRMAAFLGGQAWIVDITAVRCLGGRLRHLLKCPRAHEGNFQSLYFWAGEVACRHCHKLRYRSNLAADATDRARIARAKLLAMMGARTGDDFAARRPYKWRSGYLRSSARLARLSGVHYISLRSWLEDQAAGVARRAPPA